MSFEYYTNWWIKSKKELETLTQKDENFGAKNKTINNRNLANALIGGLYAKYCMLVQNLCTCIDQMAQPQRRISVKKLVDSACIRLNELNDELRKISMSEYHYIDGSLVELKLIPYDIEILHPCLFHHRPVEVEDMVQRIKNGEKIFVPPVPTVVAASTMDIRGDKSVSFIADNRKPMVDKPMPVEARRTFTDGLQETGSIQGSQDGRRSSRSIKVRISQQIVGLRSDLSPEEEAERINKTAARISLILVQTAERARQDRVYFFEKKVMYLRAQEMRQAAAAKKETTKGPDLASTNCAAQKMQKIWRGYRDRQNLKFREDQRRLLIGMTEPSWNSVKEFEIFESNLEKRRKYRDEKIKEYVEAIDKEKVRILRVVAPGLLEDISDEIMEWFRQWYIGARTFDNYPPEEKGGTILVVRGETMTPKEYLDDYEKKRREKVKAGGQDKLKEQQKKEKQKKEEEEKKKKEAEKKKKEAEAKKKKKKGKGGEFEYEYGETLSKELRNIGQEEFRKIWNERNPFDNPEDSTYLDLITEEKCCELQLEVRREADELMRIELDLLQEALAKDKGKKYKKKKQKKKKGKKKGKKDITADRLTEDLFQELVLNGVIRQYPKATLDQYRGDFNYKGTELRKLDFDPPAACLDVRQAVALNCIQPLGVEAMKKPRSVLIAGPEQSGKHLLANAVFYHSQCVLFDLSPKVTADIYPGNKGLAMLIHLVAKMSRILQPSVIFFDGAEKIFYKKVPKQEKDLDPKRVGKKLVKGIIKTIKPEDRILVLGITSAPWLAQGAKLKKAFERSVSALLISKDGISITDDDEEHDANASGVYDFKNGISYISILIPRPDYGSVYLWWRELLKPYPGVDRDFNFTSLATATVYQQYPVIKHVVETVLTPRRIIQLKYNPLSAQELYEEFVSNQIEPMSDKEWKKYIKWYNKTPLGKERAAFNKWADAKREVEMKQQDKQKKGK